MRSPACVSSKRTGGRSGWSGVTDGTMIQRPCGGRDGVNAIGTTVRSTYVVPGCQCVEIASTPWTSARNGSLSSLFDRRFAG
jgi:hypothetical protein